MKKEGGKSRLQYFKRLWILIPGGLILPSAPESPSLYLEGVDPKPQNATKAPGEFSAGVLGTQEESSLPLSVNLPLISSLFLQTSVRAPTSAAALILPAQPPKTVKTARKQVEGGHLERGRKDSFMK